jgi:hypothetical protein
LIYHSNIKTPVSTSYSTIDSQLDRKIDRKLCSNLYNKTDKKIDSKIDNKIDSHIDSKIDSKLDSNIDSKSNKSIFRKLFIDEPIGRSNYLISQLFKWIDKYIVKFLLISAASLLIYLTIQPDRQLTISLTLLVSLLVIYNPYR